MNFIRSLIIFLIVFISGCSSSTVINATLSTSGDVNPDLSGRASPIVVNIYELKNIGNFAGADFYRLFDHPQATLGEDLISTERFHLNPDEIQTYYHTVSDETNYVAVTAAYRNLEHAIWKGHVSIPSSETTDLMVFLNKLNINIIKTNH